MLSGLGVVSAPLAGVYVVDFWGQQTSSGAPADSPAFCPRALATWALGSAVGLAETYSGGHALTRIPAIDSILITAIAQALMNRSRRHAE